MKPLKTSYRHGFIGIGKMGQTMLRGLLASSQAKPSEILVSQPFAAELRAIQKQFTVAFTRDNLEVAKRCRFIWLGVKPYQAREVLEAVGSFLRSDARVISFMAGVSVSFLRHYLGKGPRIIRAMPNTPCLLGAGMTGVFFPKGTDRAAQKAIQKILTTLGEVKVFPREIDLDAVTGLSGSGPAFVYEVARGLIQGGIQSGLKPDAARILALQTLIGASRMVLDTGEDMETLIRQVATPGGTTEAGLKVLAAEGTSEALAGAVLSATRRAQEIREENDRCLP